MLSIRDPPFPPEERCQPRHWERDLIVEHTDESAIASVVERQTRLIRLVHLSAPLRGRRPCRTDRPDARA
jgi:IS30 family transposase